MQPISSASAPSAPVEMSGKSDLSGVSSAATPEPPQAVGEIQLGAQRARVFSPAGLQKLSEIQAAGPGRQSGVGRQSAADVSRQSVADVDLQIRG